MSWEIEHADTPPPAEIEALLGRDFADDAPAVYDSSWKNDESPSVTFDRQVLPGGERFVALFWSHDATIAAYGVKRYAVNVWVDGAISRCYATDCVEDAVDYFVDVSQEMAKESADVTAVMPPDAMKGWDEMSPEDYANSEEYKRRVAEMKAKG